MSHGSLGTETTKSSSSLQSLTSLASDDASDIVTSPNTTPVKQTSSNPTGNIQVSRDLKGIHLETVDKNSKSSPVRACSKDVTSSSQDDVIAQSGCVVSVDFTSSNSGTLTTQSYPPHIIPTVVTEDMDEDAQCNTETPARHVSPKPPSDHRHDDSVSQHNLLHPGKSFGKSIENPPDKPPDDLFESPTGNLEIVESPDTPVTVIQAAESDSVEQLKTLPNRVASPGMSSAPLTIKASLEPVLTIRTSVASVPNGAEALPQLAVTASCLPETTRTDSPAKVTPKAVTSVAPTSATHDTLSCVTSSNALTAEISSKASLSSGTQRMSPKSDSELAKGIVVASSAPTVATNSSAMSIKSLPVTSSGKEQMVTRPNLAVMTTSIQPSRISVSSNSPAAIQNLIHASGTVNMPVQHTQPMTTLLAGGVYQMPRLAGVPAGYIPQPIQQSNTGLHGSAASVQPTLPLGRQPTPLAGASKFLRFSWQTLECFFNKHIVKPIHV